MNDTNVNTAIIIILICHLATIIIGCKMRKINLSIAYLNIVIVIGLFVVWSTNSLNIKQHNFELSELLIASIEVCVLIPGLFTIFSSLTKPIVKIINYIGFSFHLLTTIGMLYFMFTFKLDKLF